MTEFVQFLVAGVLTGGTYALIASGLGLIFGVLRIVNFAQADFMMLAMYFAYVLWAGPGIDPLIAAPLAFAVFFIVGRALHRTLISQVTGSKENHEAQVVLTLGVGLVCQTAVLLTFKSTPRLVVPPYAREGFDVGPIFVDTARLLAFVVAVIVAAGLYLFLYRTSSGRAIRAATEDWEAATYMGIDIRRVQRIAFGIGIGLTAVGGVMLSTFQPLSPFVGLEYVVVMFAAVVLGGLGSVWGAFVGGLLIGVIQQVSQVWSSASLSNVWVFVIFVLILFLRPQGLFGKKQRVI